MNHWRRICTFTFANPSLISDTIIITIIWVLCQTHKDLELKLEWADLWIWFLQKICIFDQGAIGLIVMTKIIIDVHCAVTIVCHANESRTKTGRIRLSLLSSLFALQVEHCLCFHFPSIIMLFPRIMKFLTRKVVDKSYVLYLCPKYYRCKSI